MQIPARHTLVENSRHKIISIPAQKNNFFQLEHASHCSVLLLGVSCQDKLLNNGCTFQLKYHLLLGFGY